MALPSSLSTITVTATFLKGDGTPDSGYVEFSNQIALVSSGDDVIISPYTVRSRLNDAGQIVAVLPATNDPDWQPSGWTWQVVQQFDSGGQRRYSIELPYDASGGTLDLADLVPVQASSGSVVTVSGVQSVNGDAGPAVVLDATDVGADQAGTTAAHTVAVDPHGDRNYADGAVTTHSGAVDPHGDRDYADTNKVDKSGDTMTGTLTLSDDPAVVVGDVPLSGSGGQLFLGGDVGGASSGMTTTVAADTSTAYAARVLNDSVTPFLVRGRGELQWGSGSAGRDTNLYRSGAGVLKTDDSFIATGSFTVQDSATPTKQYRFRTLGSNLDIDFAGSATFVSVFTGADFTGTQRTYFLLEKDEQLVRTTGVWRWFATDPFGSVVHDIDPLTGVAALGAKNSLTNIRLCGFKNSSGAPSTDTWDTGDLVLDSDGVWHLCTAGGTPGTWT